MATDIAARGIDIDKLKYVINYDIPNIAETYVHRIGRSGRAGEEGIAISICEPEENGYVKDIEKLIHQKIEVITENPFPQTEKPMNDKEKKEWELEKQKRKKEFFAARNRNLLKPNHPSIPDIRLDVRCISLQFPKVKIKKTTLPEQRGFQ